MRAVINGVEYEPVDTEIKEGMDVSCRECDIFKARIPKAMTQYPLCYEKGNTKVRESCYNKATKNIKRIWKKV